VEIDQTKACIPNKPPIKKSIDRILQWGSKVPLERAGLTLRVIQIARELMNTELSKFTRTSHIVNVRLPTEHIINPIKHCVCTRYRCQTTIHLIQVAVPDTTSK